MTKAACGSVTRHLLLAALLTVGTGASADWTPRAPMPTARQEVYATVHEGFLYVPGGILADGLAFTDAFERYDASADRWELLPPLPEPRHHITPAAVGEQVYVIGGFTGPFPAWRAQPDTWVYDIPSARWGIGPPLPEARGEHIAAVIGQRIHVIGGRLRATPAAEHFFAHLDTRSHHVLDTGTGQWTQAAPAPTARNSAGAAVIDGRIYVVGGRENRPQPDGTQQQVNVATLEVYDPASDSWRTLSPMPRAQGGCAAAALDGRLYVFGGEQWTPEQRVFPQSWVYDPAEDSWAPVADMPTPRHGLLADRIGQAVFVIGGATKTGGGAAVGTNERFIP